MVISTRSEITTPLGGLIDKEDLLTRLDIFGWWATDLHCNLSQDATADNRPRNGPCISMRLFKVLLISFVGISCGNDSRTQMLHALVSCNADSICVASYYFGEQRDTSVMNELLTGIEDVRISHHIRHKGMSVYYCKMSALRKISGLDITVRQTERPDSFKINQFMNWAIEKRLIAEGEKIKTKSALNKKNFK
jgi:hypothetical protein